MSDSAPPAKRQKRDHLPDRVAMSDDLPDVGGELVQVLVGDSGYGSSTSDEDDDEDEDENEEEEEDDEEYLGEEEDDTAEINADLADLADLRREEQEQEGQEDKTDNQVENMNEEKEDEALSESNDNDESGDESEDNVQVERFKNEQLFHIHKSVLCKTSAFFQSILESAWTGLDYKPIDLTDEKPEVFQMYLQWLYSGKVAVKLEANLYSYMVRVNDEVICWASLLDSYILGEQLQDTTYQNAVMQAMIDCVENGEVLPSVKAIGDMYRGTSASSPVRKLVVDFLVHRNQTHWPITFVVELGDARFADDLVAAVFKQRLPPPESKDCPP
ncbi:hypothetical protein P153DRAFT_431107 [Dothidotthia symphoricarpi CBS 119687]|uniref:BTB domain-containing protein n=1 Tax=Dothidotthia symphoricarpi CBS 119687 TaxID=1392245 RepID=A0A6A6ADW2_9PLEO|nr:uncharacterized protein P153DRAFT_431107 [Dothidotthia symphoricarpi CBS 119687]KAF2130039.1 hypothetical protein P153DRAFT_431107 [Dothidotthia symphoricarpi CBS 119687]